MKLLIAGAGGHGRVVADAAQSSDGLWSEIAFLDDGYPELSKSGAWNVVGAFDDLSRLAGPYAACVAAIGDARLRLALIERARSYGFTVPVIVHARAVVSRYSRLEAGSVVIAGAVVNIGSAAGIGCIINTGATVDHDCRLGAGVHVCPGAHLAGDVEIGARTWFGIGAVARQGVRIGADVTVGAGAVCLENVRDGAVVTGVPARERPHE
jgi:sugar O-acyltransferase (sialic acid O-acetyltransferase NeuD family)